MHILVSVKWLAGWIKKIYEKYMYYEKLFGNLLICKAT